MKKIFFQFYPARVESKRPIGTVTLDEFIEAMRNPNERTRRVFRLISLCETYGNLKRKATLKQNNLYYFTPCIYSDGLGRGYVNIGFFNGIAVMDFDHIEDAETFKHYVFYNYKCVICAYLSPSKKGVKFLVKIPVVESVEEYKEYFFGLGIEFEKFAGWDGSNQNPVLPLFQSFDPDLLHRENPTTWTTRGKMLNAFVATNVEAVKIDTTDEKKRRVYENIKKKFDEITSNGHPQVIAASVALGGYMASGYITQFEAESFVDSCIANNSYLQKGVRGYQKTARTAIQTGTKSPLKFFGD